MINFEISGEYLDLYDKEVIAQTFAINNIAEIENRNGAYSNSFKGPKTQKNRRILGYPDEINIQDDTPYTKVTCNCWEDGMIIKRGFLQVNSSGEDFEFTFFADNTNWFDLIKGRSIRDLDLSEHDHTFNSTNVFNSKDNTDGYIYPVIDYGSFTTRTRNGTSDVALTEVFTAIYVHTVIKRIFIEAGYKLDGGFASNIVYKKLVLPFTNEVFGHSQEYIDLRSTKAIKTVIESFSLPNNATSGNIKFENDSTGEGYDGELDCYDNTTWSYTPDEKVKVTFTFEATVSNYSPDGSTTTVAIFRNDITQVSTLSPSLRTSGAYTGTRTLTLDAGNYYTLKFINPGVDTRTFDIEAGSSWTIQVEPDIQEGSTVQLAPNLPDIDQADMIKDIFNRYQIITYTDIFSKTVYIEDFGILYRNLGRKNIVDWSDKIDLTEEPVMEYQIGEYGQKNNYIHTQNEDETDIATYNDNNTVLFGDGVVEFDNEFLEPSQDIYESPFAPSICKNAFTGGSNENVYLPYINKPSGESTDPRIMIFYGNASVASLSGGSISTLYYVTGSPISHIPFCYFVKKDLADNDIDGFNEGLAFDQPNDDSTTVGLLEKYFAPVKKLLEKPKVLRINLRLTPIDIINLDHLKPVYLKKYKAYFYINSINEYTGGKDSTEVELIKL